MNRAREKVGHFKNNPSIINIARHFIISRCWMLDLGSFSAISCAANKDTEDVDSRLRTGSALGQGRTVLCEMTRLSPGRSFLRQAVCDARCAASTICGDQYHVVNTSSGESIRFDIRVLTVSGVYIHLILASTNITLPVINFYDTLQRFC